jgi:Toxin SymE, type I toxin-antitoxin system
VFDHALLKPAVPDPPVRKLKIEADGDPWKGLVKPKIRLAGRWLERAGFNPGSHVQVTCVAPGVLELRSPDVLTLNEANDGSSAQPNRLP